MAWVDLVASCFFLFATWWSSCFVLQMPTIHNHMYVDMYWIFFTSLCLAAPLPFYTKRGEDENGTRHRMRCTHVSFSSSYFPQLRVQAVFGGGGGSCRVQTGASSWISVDQHLLP